MIWWISALAAWLWFIAGLQAYRKYDEDTGDGGPITAVCMIAVGPIIFSAGLIWAALRWPFKH